MFDDTVGYRLNRKRNIIHNRRHFFIATLDFEGVYSYKIPSGTPMYTASWRGLFQLAMLCANISNIIQTAQAGLGLKVFLAASSHVTQWAKDQSRTGNLDVPLKKEKTAGVSAFFKPWKGWMG